MKEPGLASVSLADAMPWLRARNDELGGIVGAFGQLLNEEFAKAWGEEGADTEIVRVCGLFAEACASALAWEECVRCTRLPDALERVRQLIVGAAGRQLDEVAKLPAMLADMVSGEIVPGAYELSLAFDFPDGWTEEYVAALHNAVAIISSADYKRSRRCAAYGTAASVVATLFVENLPSGALKSSAVSDQCLAKAS